eukprot:3710705-Rhodomonas_salina.6
MSLPAPAVQSVAEAPEAVKQPLFGQLRLDGLDLEGLAGSVGEARILRPAQLSAVGKPEDVKGHCEALTAVRKCIHACILLSNQSDQVSDASCAVSALSWVSMTAGAVIRNVWMLEVDWQDRGH